MDLQQIGWEGVNWIDLAENSIQWRAFLKLEMEIRVP